MTFDSKSNASLEDKIETLVILVPGLLIGWGCILWAIIDFKSFFIVFLFILLFVLLGLFIHFGIKAYNNEKSKRIREEASEMLNKIKTNKI